MVLKPDPPVIQYSAHGSKQYGSFNHTLRRQTSTFTQQNCALLLNHDVYIPSIHTHITYHLCVNKEPVFVPVLLYLVV